MRNKGLEVGQTKFWGIFIVSLATLSFQILITRVFSVTLVYHFAFAGISLAMLGLTVGAMTVYLFPNYFRHEKLNERLCLLSIGFAISIILSVLIHLFSPLTIQKSYESFLKMTMHFTAFTIPYTLSGTIIALLLTKYPKNVGKLYSFDLAGAGFGCVTVIVLLEFVKVISAILGLAVIAVVPAVFFAISTRKKAFVLISGIVAGGLFLGFITNVFLEKQDLSYLNVTWVKYGNTPPEADYESWNSYSRVAVYEEYHRQPEGWGFSGVRREQHPIMSQRWMNIDSEAGTVITKFNGNTEELWFLQDDLVNFAYHVRPIKETAVIGVGGGRDILSALHFGANVTGIEINNNIMHIINDVYGDFTGHLDKNPKVKFVNDEARSYITQSDKAYDLIQISLIDTWAATAAGAFALSENSLYTVEAWKTFLDKLNENGVLSVSRWYFPGHKVEGHRMLSIAAEALRRSINTNDPRKHIMALVNGGVFNIIVSKSPFTDYDIVKAQEKAQYYGFNFVFTKDYQEDPIMSFLISEDNVDNFADKNINNLFPPMDNKPFFFNTLKFRYALDFFDFNKLYNKDAGIAFSGSSNAILVLSMVLIVVLFLVLLFVFVPLFITRKKYDFTGSAPYMLYFAAIGLGFMFIEISQMQRLIIFLGHPTYGLSVLLFSLLIFAGLGSFYSEKSDSGLNLMVNLLLVVVLFGFLTVPIIEHSRDLATYLRIFIAIIILAPLGFFLGIAFPMGVRLACAKGHEMLLPWFWGINGATSVLATVLATAFSMALGISMTYWAGAVFYAICLISFLLLVRKNGKLKSA